MWLWSYHVALLSKAPFLSLVDSGHIRVSLGFLGRLHLFVLQSVHAILVIITSIHISLMLIRVELDIDRMLV